MKSISKKGLRIARMAAAVSAMILTASALSGCDDSKNWINDGVKLTVVEEGDLATGKPYKIKADRHLLELRAEHGLLFTAHQNPCRWLKNVQHSRSRMMPKTHVGDH